MNDAPSLLSADTLTVAPPASAAVSEPASAPAVIADPAPSPSAIMDAPPAPASVDASPSDTSLRTPEGGEATPSVSAAASFSDEPAPPQERPAAKSDLPNDEPPPPPSKMLVVAKALRAIEQNLANIIRLLEEGNGDASKLENGNGNGHALMLEPSLQKEIDNSLMKPVDGRVVEGVFDGQQMVGSDGKTYMVPANYASKSKLVEGDMLKLTITPKGSFIYKQIGPIERSRVIASLGFDQTISEFYATFDNRRWNVLKASVTYFRGEPGDEVVLLVPKANPSKWAAVENIIKTDPLAGKM